MVLGRQDLDENAVLAEHPPKFLGHGQGEHAHEHPNGCVRDGQVGGGAAEPAVALIFRGGTADGLLGDVQTRQLRAQEFCHPDGIVALAAAHIQNGARMALGGGFHRLDNGGIAVGFQKGPPGEDLLPGVAGIQGPLLLDGQQVHIALPGHVEVADNGELRNIYLEKYAALAELSREIDRMTMDEGEKLRRMETLRYQIEEIAKANLQDGEDDELEQRRKILQNSEKISDGIHTAVECLYGGEDSDGAAALLQQAQRELARLSRYTDGFSAICDKVTDLMYQVQDAAEEVLDAQNSLAYSADELERIESRLDVIHRLRRKYGASCSEILQYLQKAQAELDEIEFSDDHLERLKVKYQAAKKEAQLAAEKLSKNRKDAALVLSERILAELAQLDMPRVQFSCEFTQTELSANGSDQVAFYMSANAGEALKSMSKVASGGELARIMLAMKNVLAEQDRVQTLIFDEVDTGVSGRAAQKVAEKLRSVAKTKQVLCVTHLPQLAALGDTHLLIAKEERDGRTYTTVNPLDFEGRKRELARIIGGASITETTLMSAEEMLITEYK